MVDDFRGGGGGGCVGAMPFCGGSQPLSAVIFLRRPSAVSESRSALAFFSAFSA